jgi:hypothetical protein
MLTDTMAGLTKGVTKRGEDAFGIGVGTHDFTHCRELCDSAEV